jgi:hypothetical protein
MRSFSVMKKRQPSHGLGEDSMGRRVHPRLAAERRHHKDSNRKRKIRLSLSGCLLPFPVSLVDSGITFGTQEENLG